MKKFLVLWFFVFLALIPVSSSAEMEESVSPESEEEAAEAESSYIPTYKQFLEFDVNSIRVPSAFRFTDTMQAFESEDRLHLNVDVRYEYNTWSYKARTYWWEEKKFESEASKEVFFVDAEYSLLKGKDFDLRLSYSFFQNLFNSSDFNGDDSQDHVVSLTGLYRTLVFKIPVYIFASYSYDYKYFTDLDHLHYDTQTVRPGLIIVENKNNCTLLQYTYQEVIGHYSEDSWKGISHEFGIVHNIHTSDFRHYFYAGYLYNFWPNNYGYTPTQNGFSAGAQLSLPYRFKINGDYSYTAYETGTQYNIKEFTNIIAARLSEELFKNFYLFGEFFYVNQEIKTFFPYTRERMVYSLGLNWVY